MYRFSHFYPSDSTPNPAGAGGGEVSKQLCGAELPTREGTTTPLLCFNTWVHVVFYKSSKI